MSQTTIQTNLTIAGRNYPVELTTDEQPEMLTLVNSINEVVSDFQKVYPAKDKLDLVTMAFLHVCSDMMAANKLQIDLLSSNLTEIEDILTSTE